MLTELWLTGQMGSHGGLDSFETDAGRVEMCVISPMDREQRLIQVIRTMRLEIRKLELENMGLRRRAGANLRKNATVPIITAKYRGRLRTYTVISTHDMFNKAGKNNLMNLQTVKCV